MKSDWLKIKSRRGIIIYSVLQGLNIWVENNKQTITKTRKYNFDPLNPTSI